MGEIDLTCFLDQMAGPGQVSHDALKFHAIDIAEQPNQYEIAGNSIFNLKEKGMTHRIHRSAPTSVRIIRNPLTGRQTAIDQSVSVGAASSTNSKAGSNDSSFKFAGGDMSFKFAGGDVSFRFAGGDIFY